MTINPSFSMYLEHFQSNLLLQSQFVCLGIQETRLNIPSQIEILLCDRDSLLFER